MERFNITTYGFGELAEEYYPEDDYRTAVRLFNRDLHRTRGLWDALQKQGASLALQLCPIHEMLIYTRQATMPIEKLFFSSCKFSHPTRNP